MFEKISRSRKKRLSSLRAVKKKKSLNQMHTAKKPTISSSFYDSYTNKPVKWYEIVDSYRQQNETYLPLRLENYPRDLWDNLKKFFKADEKNDNVEEEEEEVQETQQTRSDGNIIKVTEYNLPNEKYNSKISDAVRTHSDPVDTTNRQSAGKSRSDSRQRLTPSPSSDRRRRRRSRRHRHARISPSMLDDCPECRAMAAQGFPTMCDCTDCRSKRATYPNQVPYCNCIECQNAQRSFY